MLLPVLGFPKKHICHLLHLQQQPLQRPGLAVLCQLGRHVARCPEGCVAMTSLSAVGHHNNLPISLQLPGKFFSVQLMPVVVMTQQRDARIPIHRDSYNIFGRSADNVVIGLFL